MSVFVIDCGLQSGFLALEHNGGEGYFPLLFFSLWMSKENLWKPQCRQRYFPKGWHNGRRYDSLLLHTNSAHRSTVFRKIKFKLGNNWFLFFSTCFLPKISSVPKIMHCAYSPLLQCLPFTLSVLPKPLNPSTMRSIPSGASHVTSHLSFLNATVWQTVLLRQMDSLGRKSQHTFLIHLSGHAYLQIFPNNHRMVPTRSSPKG